jgi:hypothetical protein
MAEPEIGFHVVFEQMEQALKRLQIKACAALCNQAT